MGSNNEQQEQHTEDTSWNSSDSESSNHPSGGFSQESDHDQGSGHDSDSHSSHPRSNAGSKPGSDSESESNSSSSNDDQAGNFSDMFNRKVGSSITTPKKPESCGESSSCSWSREAEGHKLPHIPSPECRGIMRIHRSPSRPRPSVRLTAALINIHEHPI